LQRHSHFMGALVGGAISAIDLALQEYTGESDPPKRDMVVQPLVLKDGYLEVPDAPGLGIELNDSALARLKLREVVTEPPIGRDGSVQDW
jgi:galactonate dehydratase